jgi:single-strand DNA-binding protein
MAGTMNKVILVGRLGKNAETKSVNDTTVTKFSVATENRFKRGDEWVTETDWHNVTIWRSGKLAEYLTKGKQVIVEGRLQTRKYEKDGETRYSTEIVAESVGLLGGGDAGSRGADGAGSDYRGSGDGIVSRPRSSARKADLDGEGITDDDVPF